MTKLVFAERIPASTFRRSSMFSRTRSRNCLISSSRLSFRSLWPRTAVFSLFFWRVSSIRVGFTCVDATLHSPSFQVFYCDLLFSIVHIEELVIDTFQFASWKNGEQLPSNLQSLFDITVGIVTLRYIFFFKCICKFCINQVDV